MRWLLAITFLCVAFFLAFPRFDLLVSAPFVAFPDNNIEPHGFAHLQWEPWVRGLFLWVRHLSGVYILLFVAAGVYKSLFGLAWLSWRQWGYLGMVAVIGNCLLVDVIGKEMIDRPRPREITEFQGTLDYVPPLYIGTQGGNSALSGHAAFGFYVAAFAFLCRRRALFYMLGAALGLGIGFTRIIAGGHFASDILFTGLIMLWTIHLLAWIMLPKTTRE